MTQGLNFPILLNPPKKIPITHEQFNNLSYIGLASILCNYKVLIGKGEDVYTLYMSEGNEEPFYNNKRFEDLKKCWFINRSAELVYCKIPIGHPLVELINRKFSHFIMD